MSKISFSQLFLLLCVFFQTGHAQNARDTVYVNELNAATRTLITSGEYLKADSVALLAGRIARENKFQKGIFYSSTNLGVLYWYQSNFPEALKHYLNALRIAEEMNDKVLMARALANVGLLFSSEKEYAKSLEYNLRSLQLKRELKDSKGVIRLENNIATVYKSAGDTGNALKYFHSSLKQARNLNDSGMIGLTLSHIGGLMQQAGRKDSAAFFYNEALGIARRISDKVLTASVLGELGGLFLKNNDLLNAENYLKEGLKIADKLGLLEEQKDICMSLNELYKKENNWKEAHYYYKRSSELKDSIFNEEKTKALVRSEMNFGFEKKEALAKLEQEKKDLLSAEELRQQKQQRNYFVAGFAVTLVLAALIFIGYSQKKKANKIIERQKSEVEKQKAIVESQKQLLEEHQKEILDSIEYAKRIQYALLAGDDLLQNNLPEHFVLFKPKDVVSGDFYWAAPTPEGFLFITADCTGHGVPGAFMSLLNISKLSQAVNEKEIYRPDEILNYVRKEIIQALNPSGRKEDSKDGMDAILCKLDTKKMRLEFAAANNSFYLVRNGQLMILKADKMPVGKGADDSKSFTFNEIELQKGDVIYTLTDGYADQFGGPKGKKFKYNQPEKTLLEVSALSLDQQKERINTIFEDWRGNLEQVDDVCIIGIKI